MPAVRQHGLIETRYGVERRFQVDVLKRSWAEDLRLHLAAQRHDRRSVHLRVPEPREEIGRTRSGDPEARGGLSGELGVARAGERSRALVSHAEIAQVAGLFAQAQRIGKA